MRSLWTCRNGHPWSTLLPSHGLIYRRSIHRPRLSNKTGIAGSSELRWVTRAQ